MSGPELVDSRWVRRLFMVVSRVERRSERADCPAMTGERRESMAEAVAAEAAAMDWASVS